MKPYSMDLRQRVLTDCDAGLPTAQVAAKYTVSPAWVRRLKQRRRETGEVAPRAGRHGPKPSWDAYTDVLCDAVRQQPDATLGRAVAALRLTVKKKSSAPPSRTAPT